MQFENAFMKELARRHSTKEIKANTFYAEYISDKDHLHMNATKWTSLTEFIKDLGRRGLVKVEEKPDQGWYITYIDRRPGANDTEAERQARKEKTVLDDAERDRVRAEAQRRAAEEMGLVAEEDVAPTELNRDEDEEPLEFSLAIQSAPEPPEAASKPGKRDVYVAFGDDDDDDDDAANDNATFAAPAKPKSALEEIKERELERRKRQARDNVAPAPAPAPPRGWLVKGIDVKVLNRDLAGGEYYKKKGQVTETHMDGTMADVEMRDSGDVIRVAMQQLETVLPQPGGRVLVVQGKARRGEKGTLERINTERFNATVKFSDGFTADFPYEDICKYA